MKFRLIPILVLLFLLPAASLAQEAGLVKWTRIETRDHEVSAAFPPGYLVDTIEDAPGLEAHIFGYMDGVRVELRAVKNPRAKDQLKYMSAADGRNETNFTVDKLQGRRIWSRDGAETFHETTYLASDSHFYSFTVRASDPKTPAIARFLYSIQVKGKPLYIQKEKKEYQEDLVSLEKIQSSPEVAEAYKREYKKSEIKIDYRPMSAFNETDNFENVSRPPVMLKKGRFDYKFTDSSSLKEGSRNYSAKLKINFLANGEIGDITAYSDESRGYVDACVDSVRKAKFIPALLGGKNIDFVQTEECTTTLTVASYPEYRR